MAFHSDGLYSDGLYSDGLYSDGLYSYGPELLPPKPPPARWTLQLMRCIGAGRTCASVSALKFGSWSDVVTFFFCACVWACHHCYPHPTEVIYRSPPNSHKLFIGHLPTATVERRRDRCLRLEVQVPLRARLEVVRRAAQR